MNHHHFLIFLLVFTLTSSAQKQSRYDSIFYNTALRINCIDANRAENVADSLFKASTEDIYKVKSLMLKSDILVKQSKREEAIEYALKAEKLAITISDYKCLAKIYTFLASQYRLVGLKDLGRKYLEQGFENAKKIKNNQASDLYFGFVFQEKAQYAKSEKNYNESIKFLKQANHLFEKQEITKKRILFVGMNSVMIAESFIDLKQNDSAWFYLNKSLILFDEIGVKDSEFVGEAFNGKGQILLEEKKYDQASAFLMKSLKIAEAGNYRILLQSIYKNLLQLFKDTGDLENYNMYIKKYLDEGEEIAKSEKKALNLQVNRILESQEADSSKLHAIILGITLLLLANMIFVFITKRNQIKDNKKFIEIISDLKTQANASVKDGLFLGLAQIETSRSVSYHSEKFMPEETEQLILKKLSKFENKNGFINSNITLSMLSSDFCVNTKYLSYVINKHKKKDFNNYINELRISYISKKIINNPEYLNYKISYLSSECGFSSHSKFSAVFKKEKGISPSVFIDEISSKRGKFQQENMIK
ncbi:helix-turn-helix domain-containing protein [uncultured Formosa sp.]|uniref:helix-turn-helix domain-containing protein n=1 Tax=uncultured Formosa sp. TaxID=255435 RepID=UPI0026177ADC|nr:helix-turn-helix domain-containing protein [uncultured Formosa sp.]